MLNPIAEVVMVATENWWKERHIAKLMARYLGLLWDEHRHVLEKTQVEKSVFLELVHKTAGTQEPLAMELQTRIASHN